MYGSGRSASYIPLPETAKSTIALAFSADGEYFASTHGDHTVKVRPPLPCQETPGPPPQCPAQHLGPHHTPQHRTARSMRRARGGVAARTGTAAWGRVPPTPRAPPWPLRPRCEERRRRPVPGCSVVPPASPWAGVPLCNLDGGVRAHRPRAHALDGQVPPAQQPSARLGLARPDRAHLGREHQAVPLPAPFRLCRLLHRLPLERRAARRGCGQAHLVVAVRPPRPLPPSLASPPPLAPSCGPPTPPVVAWQVAAARAAPGAHRRRAAPPLRPYEQHGGGRRLGGPPATRRA